MNVVGWVKGQWAQLPHQVQAGLTVVGAALFAYVGKNALTGNLCKTWACVQTRWPEMIDTGIVALFMFYMKPNKTESPAPPTPPAP